jgi:LemA protein
MMLTTLLFILVVLLLAAVAAVLTAVSLHNRLAVLAQRCEQAFADVDVQLRARHELIPNLVETVRGFATHERATLDSVMSARKAALAAATPTAQMQAEMALGNNLRQLIAVAESYPDLQGSRHFTELRNEIADAENKIAASRRFMNMATAEYNASLGQFPTNLIARNSGHAKRRFFDLGVERVFVEDAPVVKF